MYIKTCPSCDQQNPEIKIKCLKCGYFIGDVDPILVSEASAPTEQHNGEPIDNPAPRSNEHDKWHGQENAGKTQRFSIPMLTIEHAGKIYSIDPGMEMGKADEDSTADLQIHGLPNYIHRRHCRFDYVDHQWQVTPIENDEFTNPTKLNGAKVAPNQSKPLHNGDRLTLCDINFLVRIV